MTGTLDILGLTSDRFVAAAGPPAALAWYRCCFREGVVDDPRIVRPDMPVVRVEREGTTTKFTQRLPGDGGLETESVVLPQHGRTGRLRRTLCVSSQVGCAMGCTFCETARMGLMRNLTAAEIVGQWYAARFEMATDVTNVVFMGMGEPMDNLDAVLTAVEVLADRNGPAVPASRIAISTVGRIDGIRRLAAFSRRPGFRQLRLAVSLNASNDGVRSRIMPLNRSTGMEELRAVLGEWPAAPRLPLLIEYVLIPGVNDAPEHARELVAYLAPLACSINVIPYNPRRDSPWPAPEAEDVERFVAAVRAAGGVVRRRRTMGREIMGACGQLGNPGIRRRRFVAPPIRA